MSPYHKLAVWTVLWVCAFSAPVLCQVARTPQERFNQGVELAEKGIFEDAVSVFLKVLDELPAEEQDRAHKALGFCYRKLKQLPEAWHYLTSYLDLHPEGDAAVTEWLRDVETELKLERVKVSLRCSGDSAWFQPRAGGPRMSCPTDWWFLPGKVTLEAGSMHTPSRTVEIDVNAGVAGQEFTIRLAPFAETPPILDKGVEPTDGKKTSKARVWQWVTLGSGAGMLVAGVALQVVGHNKNESLHDQYMDAVKYPDAAAAQALYDDAYPDKVQPYLTSAYVLYGVGGVAAASGLVWMLLDSRKPEPSSVSLVPMMGPGEAGAMIQVGF